MSVLRIEPAKVLKEQPGVGHQEEAPRTSLALSSGQHPLDLSLPSLQTGMLQLKVRHGVKVSSLGKRGRM